MSRQQALPESELPEGKRQVVNVPGRSLLLMRNAGEIYALDSACPHLRLPLQAGKTTEDGAIVCPWHHSAFDLHTGDVKAWSPWPPGVGRVLGAISRAKTLPVHPTKVEDGMIWVNSEGAT